MSTGPRTYNDQTINALLRRLFGHDANVSMEVLLQMISSAARVYKEFIEGDDRTGSSIDRVALFDYRSGVLESEVMTPLVLHLLDSDLPPIEKHQLRKAFDVIESWMVRRMLIRATTQQYNQIFSEIISTLTAGDRSQAGDLIEAFFARQTSASKYWPDDLEVQNEILDLPAYRRLSRSRLRMVFEAFEDHLRGWSSDGGGSYSGERASENVRHRAHHAAQVAGKLANISRRRGAARAFDTYHREFSAVDRALKLQSLKWSLARRFGQA